MTTAATLTDHRQRIKRIMLHMRFIPMDFATESIRQRLTEAGFDPLKKSLFILEGLVPYVSREVFTGILNFVAGHATARHGLVFDYLPPSVIDGTCPWVEGRNMVREVREHGETFKLGFEKNELASWLAARGFTVLENINAPDLRQRYFNGSSARRPITPVFWFSHAVAGGAG